MDSRQCRPWSLQKADGLIVGFYEDTTQTKALIGSSIVFQL